MTVIKTLVSIGMLAVAGGAGYALGRLEKKFGERRDKK